MIDINEYSFYRINLKLSTVKNRYLGYHLVEVATFVHVRSFVAVKECLRLLQFQLYDLLNMKVTFNK